MEQPPDTSTPPDRKRKKNKVRSAWISFGGRILAQIIGAAASVALGIYFIQRSQPVTPAGPPSPPARVESPRSAGEVTIAVLPLSNFSADDQEYFADGMTEALTAELAQIKGLHVISRTSVMQYKKSQTPIPRIAQDLGVDYVVEGSVVRADGRVRVTAQLIEAKSDVHKWARSYERTLRDVLTLQATVAAEIAGEVKGVLAVPLSRQRPAVDPAVYDLYLRGRHAWALRTPEGFDNAIKYFTDATTRDPGFALGYAGLADAFSLYPTNSLVNRSVDNFARARAAAEKAITLDDGLAEAHTSLAAVHFFGEQNFAAASREFERALELNEHYSTAHQWYAIALSENGRHAEALAHAEEAVRQDPLNGVMHQALGLVRYYARDLARAEASERRALQLNPQLPLARVVLAKALVLLNRPQEAVSMCEQAPQPRSADIVLMLAIAQARAGNVAAAGALIDEMSRRRPRPIVVLAQWHAARGEYDEAFGLIQSIDGGMPPMMRIDPLFEGFRSDRRFQGSGTRNP